MNKKEELIFQIKKKNIILAYLIWWFIGLFGIHRFYMNKEKAILMLSLSIISFLTMILLIGYIIFIGMLIWWLIDGINLYKWVEEYNLNLLEDKGIN